MALAHSNAIAEPVDGEQRYEDEVGGNDRRVAGGLTDAPRTGVDGIAGAKRHPAVAVGKAGKRGFLAHCPGPGERGEGAEFVLHRKIGGDDAACEQQGVEQFGKPGLQFDPGVVVEACGVGPALGAHGGAQGLLGRLGEGNG